MYKFKSHKKSPPTIWSLNSPFFTEPLSTIIGDKYLFLSTDFWKLHNKISLSQKHIKHPCKLKFIVLLTKTKSKGLFLWGGGGGIRLPISTWSIKCSLWPSPPTGSSGNWPSYPQRQEHDGNVSKCHRTFGAASPLKVFLGEQRHVGEPHGQILTRNKESTDEVIESGNKSDWF